MSSGDQPAFPVPMVPCDSQGGFTGVQCPGMSKRYVTALAALPVANDIVINMSIETAAKRLGMTTEQYHAAGFPYAELLADEAFKIADAMLAREQEGK